MEPVLGPLAGVAGLRYFGFMTAVDRQKRSISIASDCPAPPEVAAYNRCSKFFATNQWPTT
jgi:hypothetical protein